MTQETLFFILLGGIVVFGTVGTIVAASPVSSALSLVLTFLGLAGIYLLLNAPFVAVVQVIVYAGAIMVLFLFTIMLLNLKAFEKRSFSIKHAVGFLVSIVFLVVLAKAIKDELLSMPALNLESNMDTVTLGKAIFSGSYLFPFEVTSVLLLLAILGAFLLTRRILVSKE